MHRQETGDRLKALWIRVEAHDVDSSDIHKFATALGVSKIMALGYSTALAGAIAEQTDDGRIDQLEDDQLEEWARWGGKVGKLASAVRDHLRADDGTYRDWTETMGKLIERRAKDRQRKQLGADKPKGVAAVSAERPRNFHGNPNPIPRSVRGNSAATERNGTERNETVTTTAQLAESREREPVNRSASLRSKSEPRPQPLGILPPNAQRLLDLVWPVRGPKRADKERQLRILAAGEILTIGKGRYVQAYSIERLDAKCFAVIEEDALRDPDQALAVLFAKLGDTSDLDAAGALPGQLEAEQFRDDAPPERSSEAWPTQLGDSVTDVVRSLTDHEGDRG